MIKECFVCKKIIHRTPKQIADSKSGNVFCSSKCAAKHNNQLRIKSKDKVCKLCSITKVIQRYTYCSLCKEFKINKILDTTIADIKELYKNKSSLAVHAKLRGYAKTIYEGSNKPKHCIICGYSKHYEVCHIKPVASFPDTAMIRDIHGIDNLVALCPNHHWEFDKGLISLI